MKVSLVLRDLEWNYSNTYIFSFVLNHFGNYESIKLCSSDYCYYHCLKVIHKQWYQYSYDYHMILIKKSILKSIFTTLYYVCFVKIEYECYKCH